MGILVLLALGAMLLSGGKAKAAAPTRTRVNIGPARIKAPAPSKAAPAKVTIGPARIKPTPTVKLGPARIKPSAPAAAPSKPVSVVLPETPRETVAIAALVAKQAGSNPLPSDAQLAAAGAQSMADHIRTNGHKYSRPKLASWQTLAGLKPDGLYGPATQKRLRELGAKNVTGALFKGAAK